MPLTARTSLSRASGALVFVVFFLSWFFFYFFLILAPHATLLLFSLFWGVKFTFYVLRVIFICLFPPPPGASPRAPCVWCGRPNKKKNSPPVCARRGGLGGELVGWCVVRRWRCTRIEFHCDRVA